MITFHYKFKHTKKVQIWERNNLYRLSPCPHATMNVLGRGMSPTIFSSIKKQNNSNNINNNKRVNGSLKKRVASTWQKYKSDN